MEAATTVFRTPVGVVRPPKVAARTRLTGAICGSFAGLDSNLRWLKRSSLTSNSKLLSGRLTSGRKVASFNIKASASSDSSGSNAPVAPLQLESPVGQFLSQILVSHPHLLPAAVEQQLEQLQTDLETQKQKEDPSLTGTDVVLYRRIAEVKANERKRTLEEILYALIVQKFMDAKVTLIPTVSSSSNPTGRVDVWPTEEGTKLERLHSPEAYEMIQNHLALILGNRVGDTASVAQISKLRVGQVYAASVMYGYFLRRVDQLFQLEKSIKFLPQSGLDEDEMKSQQPMGETAEAVAFEAPPHPEVETTWGGGISPGGFGHGMRPSRLRSYVMSFDAETLQRCATIRSKEAVSIVEKHTEALFGKPEIMVTPDGMVDSSRDEMIRIGFSGLKRLVLEAVTFGSFLWDVESYVDSKCRFVLN